MLGAYALAGIAEVGDILGLDILNPLKSDWAIHAAGSGDPYIVPDTVTKFEFRGERRVSDYPMEQGAFASYNKVRLPLEIRMTMVCSGLNYAQQAIGAAEDFLGLNSGGGPMQRGPFLDAMDAMLDTLDLFDIVTPDRTYQGLNMEHYDFKKETSNGATMLIIEVWFREIPMTAMSAYISTNSPSAADPVSAGSVKTSPLGTNPGSAGVFENGPFQ